jgi:hypothetical protein
MEKLQDWDALSVGILDTVKHQLKFITYGETQANETIAQLYHCAENITEAILVFTHLGKKENLKLAMELTSKPYFSRHWNY